MQIIDAVSSSGFNCCNIKLWCEKHDDVNGIKETMIVGCVRAYAMSLKIEKNLSLLIDDLQSED